ncbi:MAG: phage scaffolding protein [Clostridia bacterium]|nr:phage scaffolding protein [Clostridia bacterium]
MDETKEILPGETGEGTDGGKETDALETLKAEHEEKLRQVRIDGEVRYVLARMGAKNPALAAKALDLSGVQADENGVSGVEESVKRLMSSDPYLFGFGQMAPSGHEASSGAVHGESRRDPDTLSDREYYDMLLKR